MISERNLYWLAGILEGEGSFLNGSPSKPHNPAISIQMCDKDVVAKIAAIFHVGLHPCKPRKPHHKVAFQCLVRGWNAVSWMKVLRPLMSVRRKQQIDTALSTYKILDRSCSWTKINKSELETSRVRIATGESLRSVARSLSVNHETLRRRLLNIPTRNMPNDILVVK